MLTAALTPPTHLPTPPPLLQAEETNNTLKFASRAKLIRVAISKNEVLDDRGTIRRLEREVAQLRAQLGWVALGGTGGRGVAAACLCVGNLDQLEQLEWVTAQGLCTAAVCGGVGIWGGGHIGPGVTGALRREVPWPECEGTAVMCSMHAGLLCLALALHPATRYVHPGLSQPLVPALQGRSAGVPSREQRQRWWCPPERSAQPAPAAGVREGAVAAAAAQLGAPAPGRGWVWGMARVWLWVWLAQQQHPSCMRTAIVVP
jgi:hypothetical protein